MFFNKFKESLCLMLTTFTKTQWAGDHFYLTDFSKWRYSRLPFRKKKKTKTKKGLVWHSNPPLFVSIFSFLSFFFFSFLEELNIGRLTLPLPFTLRAATATAEHLIPSVYRYTFIYLFILHCGSFIFCCFLFH